MRKIVLCIITLMTAMVMNGQVNQTYLTLNNGVQMPQFGLGVYSIPDGDAEYEAVEDVGEPYPDAANEEPQDIHEDAQAA